MTPQSPSHPRRSPDTSYREIGDEGGLVVMPARAEVKVLNPVGIKIFSMLDGTHTPEEIATVVSAEFEVSGEQALQDVRGFLEELAGQGMLAATEAGA